MTLARFTGSVTCTVSLIRSKNNETFFMELVYCHLLLWFGAGGLAQNHSGVQHRCPPDIERDTVRWSTHIYFYSHISRIMTTVKNGNPWLRYSSPQEWKRSMILSPGHQWVYFRTVSSPKKFLSFITWKSQSGAAFKHNPSVLKLQHFLRIILWKTC